jgi:hypothetical protein
MTCLAHDLGDLDNHGGSSFWGQMLGFDAREWL